MKKILAIIIMMAVPAFSEEVKPYNAFENGQPIGLGAGGGDPWWGFIYKTSFANDFGVAATMGGSLRTYSGNLSGSLDAGGNLLYTVRHHHLNFSALPDSSIRINLLASLRGKYSMGNKYNYEDKTSERNREFDLGLGAGPGVEFFFDRHFAIHWELPWMTYVTIANKAVKFKESYPHVCAGLIYYL